MNLENYTNHETLDQEISNRDLDLLVTTSGFIVTFLYKCKVILIAILT